MKLRQQAAGNLTTARPPVRLPLSLRDLRLVLALCLVLIMETGGL